MDYEKFSMVQGKTLTEKESNVEKHIEIEQRLTMIRKALSYQEFFYLIA